MKVETTRRGRLHGLSLSETAALQQTARLYQEARRTAFKALAAGQERDEIEGVLRQRFELDARFARDAILEAQAVHVAMRELTPRYLADVQVKIAKRQRRLARYQSGEWTPKRRPLDEIIAFWQGRLDKLQRKAGRWQAHVLCHTPPPVIFGSARACHARRRGVVRRDDWRMLRQRQFGSRGETGKGGNPQARIVLDQEPSSGGQFSVRLAVLPQQGRRLNYISAALWIDPCQQALLRQGLKDAYRVRLLNEGGQWHIHLTVREVLPADYVAHAPVECRVAGLDCNTDRICAAVISPQGNLLAHRTFWLREVPDMRSAQATWHISQALDAAMAFFQQQQARCVVLEELRFAQTQDPHRRSNRATSRFRSSMVKLAARQTLRSGLSVVEVNPAYTSIIGKHKYATAYGLSNHEAAALVIARRGQQREESLPKAMVAQLPALRSALLTAAQNDPGSYQRRRFGLWARQLATWKRWPLGTVWSIGEGACQLIQSNV